MDVLIGIFSESFWYVAPILVTLTTAISGALNQGISKLTEVPSWVKQLISWFVGAGLSVVAWGIKAISFGNPVWLGVIALAIVVGLSSNGFYDIPFIRNWVNTWFTGKKAVEDK